MIKRGFASDNNAGVHPEILKSMEACNIGHAIAYGGDDYTRAVENKIKSMFEQETEVFFVFNGTAANVLGLSASARPYHAVVCAETAHINVDECGAPEKFTSCKLIPIKTSNGKLLPETVKPVLHSFGVEHHVQPRIISISQSTELGTVYTPAEIKSLADLAHEYDMLLHIDGARISNAAVSLNMDFDEFTGQVGADILSFGGTKNGLMYGEAVIFFNPALADGFKFIRKQGMQLSSKMRYIAAQFDAFLSDDLWKKNAQHANNMAKYLFEKVKNIPGISISQAVDANGVFARIPTHIISELQSKYFFYVWDEHTSEVRWMTSFDTEYEDIDQFTIELKRLLS